MGFVLDPEEARAYIEKDPRNADVVFPYLNGEDLNSRPDCSARRWVINFGEMTKEEARRYPTCWTRVENNVKPERIKKDSKKYPRMVHEWWKFWNPRPGLQQAISGIGRILAIARVSKTALPVFVPSGQVTSEQTVIFATDRDADLSLLSSAHHYWWAITRASSLKGDLRYTPSDVYETFPKPGLTDRMDKAGKELDAYRRTLMLERQLGLTKLYNQVHDPKVFDPAIERLRQIHVEIDDAVNEAYGWSDLDLGHGFHETHQASGSPSC